MGNEPECEPGAEGDPQGERGEQRAEPSAELRLVLERLPIEEQHKYNNVEAAMF